MLLSGWPLPMVTPLDAVLLDCQVEWTCCENLSATEWVNDLDDKVPVVLCWELEVKTSTCWADEDEPWEKAKKFE